MHIAEPRSATRTAPIATPINTRADAISSLALLLNSDDAELVERIIGRLHVYLSVM
jgi:hypothetical protein